MIKRYRRIVAAMLVPFVLFWSIMLPRQAYAFAPVGAPAIVIVGTLAGGAVVPLLVGATIAGVAYWAFKDLASVDGEDQVRVPAVAGVAGAVPAPVVPPGPAPLQTTKYQWSGAAGYNQLYDSPGGACVAYVAYMNTSNPTVQEFRLDSSSAAGCSYSQRVNSGGTWGVWSTPSIHSLTSSQGCPNGYSPSQGFCVLVSVYAAVPDKKMDYGRTGAALAPVAGDSIGSLSGTSMTTTSANDTVVVAGKNSAGNAMQGKIIALSGGGSKVELKTQKVDASGQTYTETQTFQTSSAGDVVSAVQTAAATSLSYDPGTKTYTETANPSGTLSPNLSPATTGTTTEPIVFPSDYARQGEAATAAQSIGNTLGPKLDKFTETSAAPGDLALPDPSTYTDFGTTFNGLLGWQLPGHSSQCPSGSFNTPWNTAYTIDTHCQLVADHWQGLQAVMMVVWSIGALFIVLRA